MQLLQVQRKQWPCCRSPCGRGRARRPLLAAGVRCRRCVSGHASPVPPAPSAAGLRGTHKAGGAARVAKALHCTAQLIRRSSHAAMPQRVKSGLQHPPPRHSSPCPVAPTWPAVEVQVLDGCAPQWPPAATTPQAAHQVPQLLQVLQAPTQCVHLAPARALPDVALGTGAAAVTGRWVRGVSMWGSACARHLEWF